MWQYYEQSVDFLVINANLDLSETSNIRALHIHIQILNAPFLMGNHQFWGGFEHCNGLYSRKGVYWDVLIKCSNLSFLSVSMKPKKISCKICIEAEENKGIKGTCYLTC